VKAARKVQEKKYQIILFKYIGEALKFALLRDRSA